MKESATSGYTKVGYNELSELIDVVRKYIPKDEKAVKLMSELQEISKEARFSPYTDYKYDVYTKLNAIYGNVYECGSETGMAVITKIEGKVPQYDPNKDF